MNISPVTSYQNKQSQNYSPSFGNSSAYKKAIKWGTEKVMAPFFNSKSMEWFAEKTKNVDNMYNHMSVLGSVVTTSFYIKGTLTKKSLDKRKRRTLAINQGLVTLVSTYGAYKLNKGLNELVKPIIHKYREVNSAKPNLPSAVKGLEMAKGLLIFSMMYRYVSPVLVTPFANKAGNWLNNWLDKRNAKKAEMAKQAGVNTQA